MYEIFHPASTIRNNNNTTVPIIHIEFHEYKTIINSIKAIHIATRYQVNNWLSEKWEEKEGAVCILRFKKKIDLVVRS